MTSNSFRSDAESIGARGELDSRARSRPTLVCQLLVALLWLLSVVPTAIQSVIVGHTADVVGADSNSLPVAVLTSQLLAYSSVVLCAGCIVWRLRSGNHETVALLAVILTPWLVGGLSLAINDHTINRGLIFYPAFAVAVWILRPDVLHIARTLGWLTTATAGISVAFGVFLPSRGLAVSTSIYSSPDSEAKAIFPGDLLTGPFGHPNLLGIILCLGAGGVLAITSKALRISALGLISVALLWSASRTSLLAFALSVGLAYSATHFLKRPASRRLMITVGLVTAAALTVYSPLSTRDPLAFTQRGQIWIGSLDYFERSPILGFGPNFYANIGAYDNPLGPYAFYGHNLLVDTLATTGLVGLLAQLAFLCVAWYKATRPAALALGAPAAFVLAYFWTSWLEVPQTSFANINSRAVVGFIPMLLVVLGSYRPAAGLESTANGDEHSASLSSRGPHASASTLGPEAYAN